MKRANEIRPCQNVHILRKAFGPLDSQEALEQYRAWIESFRGESVTFPKLEYKRDKVIECLKKGITNKTKIAKIVGCTRAYVHRVMATSHKVSERERLEHRCKKIFNAPDTPGLYERLRVPMAGKTLYVSVRPIRKNEYIIQQYKEGKTARAIYEELKHLYECERMRGRSGRTYKVSWSYIHRIIHNFRVHTDGFYDGRVYNRNKRNLRLQSDKNKK